jgi:hypothetical protein
MWQMGQVGPTEVVIALALVAWLVLLVMCLLKDKMLISVIGFLTGAFGVPVLAYGALRLAQPQSFWARRFYAGDKLERASMRYPGKGAAEPGAPREVAGGE